MVIFSTGLIVLNVGFVFTGPAVQVAAESLVYDLLMILDGFIIALSYFSPIKDEFSRKKPVEENR